MVAYGSSKTYVALFAEAEGFAHVHFHVVPRSPSWLVAAGQRLRKPSRGSAGERRTTAYPEPLLVWQETRPRPMEWISITGQSAPPHNEFTEDLRWHGIGREDRRHGDQ